MMTARGWPRIPLIRRATPTSLIPLTFALDEYDDSIDVDDTLADAVPVPAAAHARQFATLGRTS